MVDLATEAQVDDTIGLDGASHSPASSGRRFDVEVIAHDRLDAVAGEWQALERLSPAAAIFQSHAHLRVWARHFTDREGGARLHVALVRRSGRPVLILPLAISGMPFMKVARMAGDPIAQYSELLANPELVSSRAFEAALRSVRTAGADALILRRVRDDSTLRKVATARLNRALARQTAPFADLSGFDDHAAFLKSLPTKMRRGLVNRKNHLVRFGEHRFELMEGGPEARAAVADAIDLKRAWLIQHGALSTAFVDPATRDCLLDLAGSRASGALVFRLMINHEPAAFRFGFDHGETHFSYMSAYDGRFAQASPGKLLLNFTIEEVGKRGLQTFDMLAPAGQHKSEWCRDEIGVADYAVPLTPSGRLYADVYQARVRPALASTWHNLPPSLRSRLSALFVRI